MLASGRTFNAWFKEIGWRPGDITRLNEGGLPGAEKLALLAQVENVNTSWLLTGEGAPYLVHHVPEGHSAEGALAHYAGGDPWVKGWAHVTGQTLLHIWTRTMPHPADSSRSFVKLHLIVTNARDQLLKNRYTLGEEIPRLDFVQVQQMAAGWSGPYQLQQQGLIPQLQPDRAQDPGGSYFTPEQLETFRIRNELLQEIASLSDKDLQFVLDIVRRLLK